MINLSELRVFVTAAEEGNFSRAAERLQLSQAAISQNIHSIEKEYGVELFIRRGRTVELSEAGQAILPLAREVLHSSSRFEDAMQNATKQISGDLLMGCSTSSGRYLMPVLLSLFQNQFPSVRSRIKVLSRNEVLDQLLSEMIPLGATSRMFEHHDLESEPIFTEKVILVVPPNHPWAANGHVDPKDIVGQPMIMREESSGTRETLLEGLRVNGVTPDMLTVVMELGSSEAIELAVERGMGIAFVTEMIAARGLSLGLIKRVEMGGLTLERNIYLTRRRNYPFTRAQSLFWSFAKDQRQKLNTEIWNSLTTMGTG
jgi:DNA-binding transcriptional LysR family regulator